MKSLNSTEIAKIAGVSRSTVSRVINGYGNVTDETREKVLKIIGENNYYPNLSGQLLAGKKTGTLGFFWISEGEIAWDELSSFYFINVAEAAARRGYLVLMCILKNLTDQHNAFELKKIFKQGRIDAGIFIGLNNYEPLIEDLIADGEIVGIFDHFAEGRDEPNRITVNYETDTGTKVIDYLVKMGHKKIAVIDGDMNKYSSIMRHEGFIGGLRRHGLEMRREWLYYADVTEDAGYVAAKKLLANSGDDLPTAICVNNDAAAFGVYRALKENHISIPNQISLTGVDGHPRGVLMRPPLTTFAFDFREFFDSLVGRTIAAVEGEKDVANNVSMTSKLVERGSCLKI